MSLKLAITFKCQKCGSEEFEESTYHVSRSQLPDGVHAVEIHAVCSICGTPIGSVVEYSGADIKSVTRQRKKKLLKSKNSNQDNLFNYEGGKIEAT